MTKKLLSFLFALALTLSIGACSSSGGGDSQGGSAAEPSGSASEPAATRIVDDTNVMALSFKAPDNYQRVERFSRTDASGKLIEKDISFQIDDEITLIYAYTPDTNLGDHIDVSTLESVDQSGKTFYLYEYEGGTAAFTAEESGSYAIDFSGDAEATKEYLKGVSFTDATETILDDTTIEGISFDFGSDNICAYSVYTSEGKEPGEEEKTVLCAYGENPDSADYNLGIHAYRNKTIEDVTDSNRTYEQQTINDIEYTVHIPDDADTKPYSYYTQQGGDVFRLYNGGSSGWFSTRSDASYAAFDALVNSVSFD